MPPKGAIMPYDPENCDESFASEYGGYTFGDNASPGGRGGGRGGPRFAGCYLHIVNRPCLLTVFFHI